MTSSLVMRAILAMDAYNRGYGQGIDFNAIEGSSQSIDGSDVDTRIKIGNATIYDSSGGEVEQAAGFYGIAYTYVGETVISYRGTDRPISPLSLDVVNGYGVGVGSAQGAQALMAFQFYNTVAGGGDPRLANISLTGHSLGGRLAGITIH